MRRFLLLLLLAGPALAGPTAAAAAGDAAHHPAFKWRGVIQGSYGAPFTPGQRVRMLRFMAAHGLNAYVNAPKDDPYQRDRWREPYPPDQMAELQSEVELANRLGIQWVPNLSPAQPLFNSITTPGGVTHSAPICFSCPEDLQVLMDKYEPFIEAGARTFMLSIDDANQFFSYPQDFAAYGDDPTAYGTANADLLNRLDAALRERLPGAHLLAVGPEYLGDYDRGYLQGLRGHLNPGIDVMWTGPEIQSRQFRAEDADQYARLLGRKAIIYENWTANDQVPQDAGIPDRIYLGPYRRIPQLKGHLKGFFLNAALEADANYLPFVTAARYLDSPFTYRPRRAFLDAVKEVGKGQSETLRAFAEANYSDTLAPFEEAPTFRHLAAAVLHAYRVSARIHRVHGKSPRLRRARQRSAARLAQAAAALDRELRLVIHARGRLKRVKSLRPFVRQTAVFLDSARLAARAGVLATSLLQATPGSGAEANLRRALAGTRKLSFADPYETYGSRLRYFYMVGNVMDRYLDKVEKIDQRRSRRR